jgi:hypothetical protein
VFDGGNWLLQWQLRYPRTQSERDAGVTPVNYFYEPGHLYRYGTNATPGTTDMSGAFQDMIDSCPAGGECQLPPDLISIGTTGITCSQSITIKGTGGREDFDNSWDNAAGSRIWYKGLTGDALSFTAPNAVNSRVKLRLSGFVVRGARVSPGSATSGRCILIDGRQQSGTAIHIDMENVYACEARDEGIYITGAVYGGNCRNIGCYDNGKNGLRLEGQADPIGEMLFEQTRLFDNGAQGTGNEQAGLWAKPGASNTTFIELSCTNNQGPGAILQAGTFNIVGLQLESNDVADTAQQLYLGSAGGGLGCSAVIIDGLSISPGTNYQGTCVHVTSDANNVKIRCLDIGDTQSGAGQDLQLDGPNTSITGVRIDHTAVITVTDQTAFVEGYPRSFTPVLQFGGASTGITYSIQQARHSKDGNTLSFNLIIGLSNKGASVGAAQITGLPLNSLNLTSFNQAVTVLGDNLAATADVLAAQVLANSNTIRLYRYFDGALTQLADTDFTNTSVIVVNGQLIV